MFSAFQTPLSGRKRLKTNPTTPGTPGPSTPFRAETPRYCSWHQVVSGRLNSVISTSTVREPRTAQKETFLARSDRYAVKSLGALPSQIVGHLDANRKPIQDCPAKKLIRVGSATGFVDVRSSLAVLTVENVCFVWDCLRVCFLLVMYNDILIMLFAE